MTRARFLRLLAALPLLGWLAPRLEPLPPPPAWDPVPGPFTVTPSSLEDLERARQTQDYLNWAYQEGIISFPEPARPDDYVYSAVPYGPPYVWKDGEHDPLDDLEPGSIAWIMEPSGELTQTRVGG